MVKKKDRSSKPFIEIRGRSYKVCDLLDFSNDIKSLDIDDIFSTGDPNEIWDRIFSHIMKVVDRHFPMRTLKIPLTRPQYFDEELLRLMHQRDFAFWAARRQKTPETWALARAFRSRVSAKIRAARRCHITRQIDLVNGDSRKFWNIINDSFFKASPSKINEIQDVTTGKILRGKEAADAVNSYFCGISDRLACKFDGLPLYDHDPACQVSKSRCPVVGKNWYHQSIGFSRLTIHAPKNSTPCYPGIIHRLSESLSGEFNIPGKMEDSDRNLDPQKGEPKKSWQYPTYIASSHNWEHSGDNTEWRK